LYVTDVDELQLQKVKTKFFFYINKKIFIFKKYKDIPSSFDFCIICSTSKSRHSIIKKVLKKKVKHWILEKLVSNNLNNLIKIKSLLKNKSVYINLPRGYDKKYQFLKKKKLKKINYVLKGGNWNLASNVIHHLYNLIWLTNEKIMNINIKFFKIYKTKRKNYSDFYGSITANTFQGSKIKLINEESDDKFLINIKHNKKNYLINEHEGILKVNNKIIFNGIFNFQSNITKKIIYDIINHKKIYLPKLENIFDLHLKILKSLKKIRLFNVT
jgi:hypothetical protein